LQKRSDKAKLLKELIKKEQIDMMRKKRKELKRLEKQETLLHQKVIDKKLNNSSCNTSMVARDFKNENTLRNYFERLERVPKFDRKLQIASVNLVDKGP